MRPFGKPALNCEKDIKIDVEHMTFFENLDLRHMGCNRVR